MRLPRETAPFSLSTTRNMRVYRHYRTVASVSLALLSGGCSESTGITTPGTGSLQIELATSSVPIDVDLDGYLVSVDGGLETRVSPNGTTVFDNLTVGEHMIFFRDIAPNCSVAGENPKKVNVGESKKITSPPVAFFAFTCVGNVGNVQVSVTSSGTDIDDNGYSVVVSPNRAVLIQANGSVTVPDVRVGAYNLSLTGVSPNCDISGSAIQAVTVSFGTTASAAFNVKCESTGSVLVRTLTTGVDVPGSSYMIEFFLRDKNLTIHRSVPVNGSVNVDGFVAGTWTARVLSVPPNCDDISSASQFAVVSAGDLPRLSFELRCFTMATLLYAKGDSAKSRLYTATANGSSDVELPMHAGSNTDPAWSLDGTKVVFSSDRDGNRDLYSTDASGANEVRLTTNALNDYQPVWSPDGKRIAFVSERDLHPEIFVMDADGSNVAVLTNTLAVDGSPTWSPDGTQIAFHSNRDGRYGIWKMNADGTNPVRLTTSDSGDWDPAWSPDGQLIAFTRVGSDAHRDVFTVTANGASITRITTGMDIAKDPTWSADSRQIAFSRMRCYAGYYDDYCDRVISTVRIGGPSPSDASWITVGSNPAWRP
jgi:hypothetical protein